MTNLTTELPTHSGSASITRATRECGHIRAFARILTDRQGAAKLRDWEFAVKTDDLPALKTFATGLDKDWSAIVAGVTIPWSKWSSDRCMDGQACRYSADACYCCDQPTPPPRFTKILPELSY